MATGSLLYHGNQMRTGSLVSSGEDEDDWKSPLLRWRRVIIAARWQLAVSFPLFERWRLAVCFPLVKWGRLEVCLPLVEMKTTGSLLSSGKDEDDWKSGFLLVEMRMTGSLFYSGEDELLLQQDDDWQSAFLLDERRWLAVCFTLVKMMMTASLVWPKDGEDEDNLGEDDHDWRSASLWWRWVNVAHEGLHSASLWSKDDDWQFALLCWRCVSLLLQPDEDWQSDFLFVKMKSTGSLLPSGEDELIYIVTRWGLTVCFSLGEDEDNWQCDIPLASPM